MSKFFYARLAINNIRRNAQTYVPYIVTAIGAIMMFVIIGMMTNNTQLLKLRGGTTLRTILFFGTIVVGIFSLIFLFYTNSFLGKRRKKEFGLMNILGMDKRHLARVMFLETLIVAVISITLGILSGVLLSKLMFLVLLKILNFEVQLGFEFDAYFTLFTAMLFAGIFFLSLLNNLRQVQLANPIELVKGGQVGEREPKTNWPAFLLGLITLGSGYYIALTMENPITTIPAFFGAVVLVIIGTYCLFTAGSIWFLQLLRKNKKFYYHPQHFPNISGMIYRMKQNAVGLANICILSTMVLVMLSTTLSLYIGMEDVLRTRYRRNFELTASDIDSGAVQRIRDAVDSVLAKRGKAPQDIISYRYLALTAKQEGSSFATRKNDLDMFSTALKYVYFVPVEDYNALTNRSVVLEDNEALICSAREAYDYDSLSILGRTFTIKEKVDSFQGDGSSLVFLYSSYYVVVKDMDTVQEMYHKYTAENELYRPTISYYFGFDVDANRSESLAIHDDLVASAKQAIAGSGYVVVESAENARDDFYSLYGGLFFLGIFLGVLFIGATVLIIYYKQITEGFEDKHRFEIMQKVGMSRLEVKKTIKDQVLMVFFLPLIAAIIHIAFAFKPITKMLALFNLTNIALFIWCTLGVILVFGLFYAVVYVLTARVYYQIVSAKE